MLLTLGLIAAGAAEEEERVALIIHGPKGNVMLQDAVPLPTERVMAAPDGKHSLGVYIARMDDGRGLIELVAGKEKDGRPKPSVSFSFELEPYVLQTHNFVYKKSTWTVDAVMGQVWDAPKIEDVPSEKVRYVLAWDDADQVIDLDLELDEATKPEKKEGNVVVERELPEGRTDALAQASPMKVIAPHESSKKHVTVETLPEPGPRHCQLGGPSPEEEPTQYAIALKDFVPRLTSREVVGKFADGTGYRVAAGVPIEPIEGSEDQYQVETGGLSFVIEATSDDVAFYYRPTTHFDGEVDAPMGLGAGTIGTTDLGEVHWAGEAPLPVAGLRNLDAADRDGPGAVRRAQDPARSRDVRALIAALRPPLRW